MQSRHLLMGVLFASAVAISGCSTVFKPRIPIPARADTMDKAITQIEDAKKELGAAVDEHFMINAVTGLGVFTGAAGAGISTLFKGSRDLTLGLATLGATSYATNSVYADRTYRGVFSGGLDAIQCVSNATGPAVDAHRTLGKQLDTMRMAKADMEKHVLDPNVDTAEKPAARAAMDRANQADRLAQLRLSDEIEQAGQISGAVQNILRTVNAQIIAAAPDVGAIMRAGSSVKHSALEGVSSAEAVTKAPQPVSTPNLVPPLKSIAAEIALLNDLVDKVLATLKKEAPPADTSGCVVADLPTTPPVTIDAPAELEVKHPATVLTYKVSGGTGSYTAHWIGAEPPDVIAAMQGDRLRIFVKPGVPADQFVEKEYKLDVYDTTPGGGKHLQTPISVKTKK
jgi:hypothetical protein